MVKSEEQQLSGKGWPGDGITLYTSVFLNHFYKANQGSFYRFRFFPKMAALLSSVTLD